EVLDLRTYVRVGNEGSSLVDEAGRPVGLTRVPCRAARCSEPSGARLGVDAQLRRTTKCRRSGCVTAAKPCAFGRFFELVRHACVASDGGGRLVPDALVGAVERVGECQVHEPSFPRRQAAIDRRAYERMAELEARASQLDETCLLGAAKRLEI